jgi:hypothetical protein
MAGKSTYLEDQFLNWMKGTAVVAPTTNVYVALFTTAPADDGTGYVEVSGTSNVADGVTSAIPANCSREFEWSGTLWYRMA